MVAVFCVSKRDSNVSSNRSSSTKVSVDRKNEPQSLNDSSYKRFSELDGEKQKDFLTSLADLDANELAEVYLEFTKNNDDDALRVIFRIRSIVSSYGEPSQLVDFFSVFGKREAEQALQSVAKNSDLFEVESIKNTVEVLVANKISIKFLGTALTNKVNKIPDSDVSNAINAYLEQVEGHNNLSGTLADLWMERIGVTDHALAKDFLLNNDPEFVSKADSAFVEILAKENPNEAIAFIRELDALSQVRRASAASSEFAKYYSRTQPEEALLWAIDLPQAYKHRNKAVNYAYQSLLLKNPTRATFFEDKFKDDSDLSSRFDRVRLHLKNSNLIDDE